MLVIDKSRWKVLSAFLEIFLPIFCGLKSFQNKKFFKNSNWCSEDGRGDGASGLGKVPCEMTLEVRS